MTVEPKYVQVCLDCQYVYAIRKDEYPPSCCVSCLSPRTSLQRYNSPEPKKLSIADEVTAELDAKLAKKESTTDTTIELTLMCSDCWDYLEAEWKDNALYVEKCPNCCHEEI